MSNISSFYFGNPYNPKDLLQKIQSENQEKEDLILKENKLSQIINDSGLKKLFEDSTFSNKAITNFNLSFSSSKTGYEGWTNQDVLRFLNAFFSEKQEHRILKKEEGLEEILSSVVSKIVGQKDASFHSQQVQKLKKGEHYTMLGGWSSYPSGHVMYYRFHKESEDSCVNIYVYNASGTHVIQGGKRENGKIWTKPYLKFQDVPQKNLDTAFFKPLVEYVNGSGFGESSRIYQCFVSFKKNIVQTRSLPEIYISVQRSGNCTVKSMKCLLLDLAYSYYEKDTSKTTRVMKRLFLEMHLKTIAGMAQSLKDNKTSSAIDLLRTRQAAEAYLRFLEKQWERNYVSGEEYADLFATVQKILKIIPKKNEMEDLPCIRKVLFDKEWIRDQCVRRDSSADYWMRQFQGEATVSSSFIGVKTTPSLGQAVAQWTDVEPALQTLQTICNQLKENNEPNLALLQIECTMERLGNLKNNPCSLESSSQALSLLVKIVRVQENCYNLVQNSLQRISPSVQVAMMECYALAYRAALAADQDTQFLEGLMPRTDIFLQTFASYRCMVIESPSLLDRYRSLLNWFQKENKGKKMIFDFEASRSGWTEDDFWNENSSIHESIVYKKYEKKTFKSIDINFRKKVFQIEILKKIGIEEKSGSEFYQYLKRSSWFVQSLLLKNKYGEMNRRLSIYLQLLEENIFQKTDIGNQYLSRSFRRCKEMEELATENQSLILYHQNWKKKNDPGYYAACIEEAKPRVQTALLLQNLELHMEELLSDAVHRSIVLQALMKLVIGEEDEIIAPLFEDLRTPALMRKFENLLAKGEKLWIAPYPFELISLDPILFLIRLYGRALQIVSEQRAITQEEKSFAQGWLQWMNAARKAKTQTLEALGENKKEDQEAVLKAEIREIDLAKMSLLIPVAHKDAEWIDLFCIFWELKSALIDSTPLSDLLLWQQMQRKMFLFNWADLISSSTPSSIAQGILKQILGLSESIVQAEWEGETLVFQRQGREWKIFFREAFVTQGGVIQGIRMVDFSADRGYQELFGQRKIRMWVSKDIYSFHDERFGDIAIQIKGSRHRDLWISSIYEGSSYLNIQQCLLSSFYIPEAILKSDISVWMNQEDKSVLLIRDLATGKEICRTDKSGCFLYYDQRYVHGIQPEKISKALTIFCGSDSDGGSTRLLSFLEQGDLSSTQINRHISFHRVQTMEGDPIHFDWDDTEKKWRYVNQSQFFISEKHPYSLFRAQGSLLLESKCGSYKLLISRDAVTSKGYEPIALQTGQNIWKQQPLPWVFCFEYDLHNGGQFHSPYPEAMCYLAHLYLAQKNYEQSAQILRSFSIGHPASPLMLELLTEFLQSQLKDQSMNCITVRLIALRVLLLLDPSKAITCRCDISETIEKYRSKRDRGDLAESLALSRSEEEDLGRFAKNGGLESPPNSVFDTEAVVTDGWEGPNLKFQERTRPLEKPLEGGVLEKSIPKESPLVFFYEKRDSLLQGWKDLYLIQEEEKKDLSYSLPRHGDDELPEVKKRLDFYDRDQKIAQEKKRFSLRKGSVETLTRVVKEELQRSLSQEKELLELIGTLAEKLPSDLNDYRHTLSRRQGVSHKPHALPLILRSAAHRNYFPALRKLNPSLDDREIEQLRSACFEYMAETTHGKHLRNLQNAIEEKDEEALSALLSALRAYDPKEGSFLLLFETLSGLRVRENQKSLILQAYQSIIRNDGKKKGIAFQLIMAGGKTSVLLSVLAELAALEDTEKGEPRFLSCIASTHSQFASVVGSLNKFQKERFEKDVYVLDHSMGDLAQEEKLNTIFATLQRAWKERAPIVFKTSLLQMFELALILEGMRLAEKGSSQEKVQTLMQINLFLKEKGCVFYDESDMNLSPLIDVVVPLGEKELVGAEYADLMSYIFQRLVNNRETLAQLQKPEDLSEEIFQKTIIPFLARELVRYRPLKIAPNHESSFLRYMRGEISEKAQQMADTGEDCINEEQCLREDILFLRALKIFSRSKNQYERMVANLVAAAREIVRRVLELALSRSYNRHYGKDVKEKNGRIIPYVGANTPAHTQFGNIYLALAYQFQTALNADIEEDEFLFLADRLIVSAQVFAKRVQKHISETEESKQFFDMTGGVNLHEIRLSNNLQKALQFLNDPKNISWRLLFAQEMASMHIRDYKSKVVSTSIHCVSQVARGCAFSGTLWNYPTYHSELDVSLDEGTEGSILNVLMRKNKTIHAVTTTKEVIQQACSNPKMRALVDGGGLLKDEPAIEIAQALLQQHRDPAVEGVIYYQNNAFYLIKKGKVNSQVLANTRPETIQKEGVSIDGVVVFFDELRSTGTDFLLKKDAVFVNTIDKNMTMRSFLQAVLRARQIFKEQEVEYVITKNSQKEMFRGGTSLENILYTLVKNEALSLKKQKMISCFSQIYNIVRSEAMQEILSSRPSVGLSLMIQKYQSYFIQNTPVDPYEQFARIESLQSAEKVLSERAQSVLDSSPLSKEAKEKAQKKMQILLEHLIPLFKEERLPCPEQGNLDMAMEVLQEQEQEEELELDTELSQERECYENFGSLRASREIPWTVETFANETAQRKKSIPFVLKQSYGNRGAVTTEEYASLFPQNLGMTFNFEKTADCLLPVFHPASKRPGFVLVVERGNEYECLFVSEAEADFCKQNPNSLSRTYFLMNLKGELEVEGETGCFQAFLKKNEENFKKSLWYINLFAGNISYIEEEKKLSQQLWSKELKKKLSRFMLLRTRSKQEVRRILQSDWIDLSCMQKAKISFTFVCAYRREQIRKKQVEEIPTLGREGVEKIDPEEVEFLKDDQLRWLSTEQQVEAIPEGRLGVFIEQNRNKIAPLELLPPERVRWIPEEMRPQIRKPKLLEALQNLPGAVLTEEQKARLALPEILLAPLSDLSEGQHRKVLEEGRGEHFLAIRSRLQKTSCFYQCISLDATLQSGTLEPKELRLHIERWVETSKESAKEVWTTAIFPVLRQRNLLEEMHREYASLPQESEERRLWMRHIKPWIQSYQRIEELPDMAYEYLKEIPDNPNQEETEQRVRAVEDRYSSFFDVPRHLRGYYKPNHVFFMFLRFLLQVFAFFRALFVSRREIPT